MVYPVVQNADVYKLAVLIVLSLVNATGPALAQFETPIYDFPNYESAYDPAGAPMFELAIVTYGKRVGYEERDFKDSHGSSHVNVCLDQVEIVDSTVALPNSSIMVVPFNGGNATPFGRDPRAKLRALRPGKRYLILTAKETPDALRMPVTTYLGKNKIEDKFWANITPRRDHEFVGLLAIETVSKRLIDLDREPIERLMSNVANCLQGASLETVQRACRFLYYSRFKPYAVRVGNQVDYVKLPPDAPFISIMKSAYMKLPTSSAGRIAVILSNWGVGEGPKLLYDSIRAGYLDPNLFSLPGDIMPQGPIEYHAKRKVHDESEYQRETNEQFDLSLRAKSPIVRRYLIIRWGRIVDVERRRRAVLLAEQSTDPNDNMAETILNRLAAWFDDREHLPVRQLVGGNQKLVNKVELLKHWRTMLGMGIKG